MAGLYDDAGIMVDPFTGQIISSPQTNTPGPGILSGARRPVSPFGPAAPSGAGVVVDPLTGQIISSPQTNTPGPGIGDALSGLRRAMLPPGPAAPVAPPAVPPDADQQRAAVGLPPSGQPSPGDVKTAQEGLPPGTNQVDVGALPAPPIPPQAPPPAAPQGQPQGQPQGPLEDPLAGISNNRRNNPLNLRFAGQNGATDANGFAAFQTPEAGIAAAKNQFAINASRGINTLTGLVSSWAPPNENDTAAYIANVSKATGIPPNAPIDLRDPSIQAKLIPAMSLMENGPAGKGAAGPQMAGNGSQPTDTTTLANASAPPPGPPQGSLQADLQRPLNTALPYPNAARPQPGNGLLALASGLLSGPTYGAGMGKGLQAYLGQQQQDRQAQMGANNEFMQMQRLGLDSDYKRLTASNALQRTGLMANKPAGPPVMGVGDDGKPVAMVRLADGSTVQLPGVTPAMLNSGTSQQRLQLAQQAQTLRNDPAQLARLTQEKAAATSAQKDQDAVYASQSSDQQGLQDINEAQSLITQKPELMGPTLANRWTRFSAEIGLSGQAADLNALQKMTADQRNAFLNTLTNGHVGGIRSNAELKNLSQAVADVNTSPAAANYILNMQKSQLQAKDAWRSELTARSQTDPDSIAGRQYNVTKNQFFDDYWKQNPLPAYQSPSGTSSPTPSAAPGSPSGTPPGVSRVLRYDAKGNLVQ